MENPKVLPVEQYNEIALNAYNKKVEKWKGNKNSPFPSRGKYLFIDENGKEKTQGYVAFDNTKSYLRETEEEAIQAYKDGNKDNKGKDEPRKSDMVNITMTKDQINALDTILIVYAMMTRKEDAEATFIHQLLCKQNDISLADCAEVMLLVSDKQHEVTCDDCMNGGSCEYREKRKEIQPAVEKLRKM